MQGARLLGLHSRYGSVLVFAQHADRLRHAAPTPHRPLSQYGVATCLVSLSDMPGADWDSKPVLELLQFSTVPKAVPGRVLELKRLTVLLQTRGSAGAVLCLCTSEPLSLLPDGNKRRGMLCQGFLAESVPGLEDAICCRSSVWVMCMKCVSAPLSYGRELVGRSLEICCSSAPPERR